MVGIYCITNLINNKKYIGQSNNIGRRWKEHKENYLRPKDRSYNSPIYQAIRKYGIENFKFEILEECNIEELDEKEIYWINFYQTFIDDTNNGYNMTRGGKVGEHISKTTSNIYNILEDLNSSEDTLEKIASKYNITPQTLSQINRGIINVQPEITYPIRKRKRGPKIKNPEKLSKLNIYTNCIDCGNKLISKYTRRCKKCNIEYLKKLNSVVPPEREELLTTLFKLQNIQKTAAYYNCSSVLIGKWCRKYNLPTNRKEYTKLYRIEILKENVVEQNNKLKILKIDPITNNIVAEFNSKRAALRSVGMYNSNTATITNHIKEGTIYRNYKWQQV